MTPDGAEVLTARDSPPPVRIRGERSGLGRSR
jgi:hypothetical protein